MSRIVVDASVAVKWSIEESLREQACSILRYGARLLAPDLLFAEMANICWRKATSGEVSLQQARLVIAAARAVLPEVAPTAAHAGRALEIALALRHPAYDAVYIACAEAMDGVFLTADRRLQRAAAGSAFEPLLVGLDDPALHDRLAAAS